MSEIPATSVPATVRVVIADDQPVFLRGLGVVLSIGGRIEVVGVAENGEEAIAQAVDLVPDVILLDVGMPGVNGIEAARVISRKVPICKIIMLTASDEEDDLYQALKAGATGYLQKNTSIEEVAAVIRAVAGGQSLITPSMASKLLVDLRELPESDQHSQRYTPGDFEILKLIAKGLSNRQIGDELVISENAVKNHIRNILEKLHQERTSLR